MICFRSLNYFWLISTASGFLINGCQLWFAFVLWTTFDWYQLATASQLDPMRCDLLSFFELLLIDINWLSGGWYGRPVVICFRSLNYFWLISTRVGWSSYQYRCDLLSFFELLLIDINWMMIDDWGVWVVICFRSLNYFWLISTKRAMNTTKALLWFAFVLWTTFDWYQPIGRTVLALTRCDLLSFFELLLIDINQVNMF